MESRPSSRRSSPTRARRSSAGATCRPTIPRSRRERQADRAVHRQVFIGRGADIADEDEFERKLYIIRKVISNPIYRAYDPQADRFLPGVAVVPHAGLQGHVPRRPSSAPIIRTCTIPLSNRRWRWCISASRPTPSRPGAGASLPHGRHNGEINTLRGNVNWMAARQASVARSCSATTSPSSGRSPTKASRTPPASTTRSNSWCRAAIRCRTP
jgi:hypothetical protein